MRARGGLPEATGRPVMVPDLETMNASHLTEAEFEPIVGRARRNDLGPQ